MSRKILRTKYFNLSVVGAIMLGVAYCKEDNEIGIVVGPFLLEIKLYQFNRKPKKQSW